MRGGREPGGERDTLAGVLSAAVIASDEGERERARLVVGARSPRVAFHGEGPRHPSRLFHALPDRADLQQRLRPSLRPVDLRLLVVDLASTPATVPWTVQWRPGAVAP